MAGLPGASAGRAPAGGKVLIVDDQEDVRLMLQTVLSLDGWITEEAASGEEVVARTDASADVDVLVLDYKMPGLDGVEAAARMRRAGFERPIVICSAYLNPQVEQEASALGAHTVRKDDLPALQETIRRLAIPGWRDGARTTSARRQSSVEVDRLSAILDSSDDAFIVQTLSGIVESWNAAAERMYGYSAEEMIGRPIWVLVPEDRDNDMPALLQRARGGEKAHDYETVQETKDGRLIDVSLTVAPIVDGNGGTIGVTTIVRQLNRPDGADHESHEMLLGLMETAPDAMVIVSADGRIMLVNRQTEELFGYQREELLAQPVEMLVPARFHNRHPHHRHRYFEDPKVRPMGAGFELYAIRKGGSEFPVEISLSPMRTESGTIVSAAIRDATERRQTEERLKRVLARERDAAERLRDLDRLKDEFLSTVSHELRTPLTVISVLAGVLRESPDRPDQPELLERIVQNSSEMGGMIDQLLDYSRLEAGKVALDIRPVVLANALERCIDLVHGTMGTRPISLKISDELSVEADESALERIVVNLLTNAAKYSPEASTVELIASGEGGEVTVAVRDHGIGIPPEEQARVFERFYQGSLVSGKRGTGVGLSIVWRYVELLGGRVWVETSPGEGSTFSFTLPLSSEVKNGRA